jgi:thiol:disulfide interchange protein
MQNSKQAGRPWLFGAMFVWALVGAVGYASYSSRPEAPAKLVTPEEEPAKDPFAILEAAKASAAAAPVRQVASNEIAWEDSFEGAMQRARSEKKPILIDFYTDWCGVCKQMDSEVLPNKAVIAETRNWITIKINAEKRPDVAGAYGVTGYPTFVFAHASGKPLGILPGFAPAEEFTSIMRQTRAKWKPDAA